MKARIYILAIILAAGRLAVLAEEAKTNDAAGATAPAVPPTATAPPPSTPAAAKEAKPLAAASSTATNPVPVQPKITTTPRMSSPESTGTIQKEMVTNSPPTASTMTEAATSPDNVSAMSTSGVPVEADATTAPPPNAVAPPPERSRIDRKSSLLLGGAILVVAGGLAGLMWRRSNAISHGSLISSALQLVKYDEKNEEKPAEKGEAGTEVVSKPRTEVKKFPPPMN